MIHNHEQSTRVATGTLLAAILIFSSLCPALASKLSNESGNVSTLKHVAVITIQGHVTDEAGNPVSGARLNVKWAERVSVSDQNGEFKIENLTEKDTIVVTHSYYQMVQFALEKSKTNYFISMKKAIKTNSSDGTSTPNGESIDISGKVYDDKGVALPDAFLIVKGGNQGGSTNSNGEFNLPQVPINSKIIVTHISFYSGEFTVTKSQPAYQIALQKNLMHLDELVVVGYSPLADSTETIPQISQSDKDFLVIEQNPEFPGGIQALYKFLAQRLHYPVEASKAKVKGRAIVSFTVNERGSIRKPQIIKGLGSGIDEEILRVVLGMPLWNPARQNGKAVSKEFTLPINFTLE